jgi:hypothetical protein
MNNNNNNGNKKWRRPKNKSLRLEHPTKGYRYHVANQLRATAGLPPLSSINSMNSEIESNNYRIHKSPRTGKKRYIRSTFFPVNLAPEFMERHPTMEKTRKRVKESKRKQMSSFDIFEPRPTHSGTRKGRR